MPPSPSTPTPRPTTEEELEALFDAVVAEARESQQQEPPARDTTAAELTAEFAKLGVKGVDEAMKGLAEIFGAGNPSLAASTRRPTPRAR